jgi:cyanophycin synthetase
MIDTVNLHPCAELSRHWHITKGLVMGMNQPSIRGQVSLCPSSAKVLAVLANEVSVRTGESLPSISTEAKPVEIAAVLAHALGALQRHCNLHVSKRHYLQVANQDPQRVLMFLPMRRSKATLSLLGQLPQLFAAAWACPPYEGLEAGVRAWVEEAIKNLRLHADPRLNQYRIHEAAEQLGIPVFSIFPQVDVLGSGSYSRWFDSTLTDLTPNLGVSIAKSKWKTANLLRKVGLPGAEHVVVKDTKHLRECVEKMGYPVVVKPNDAEQGKGVSADLREWSEVEQAYGLALQHSSNILLEKHVDGYTHRLTVCQGEVIRVTQRIAGGVVGNGVDDIKTLLAQLLETPNFLRRARQLGHPPLTLDAEALQLLQRQGYSSHDVPPAGVYVRMRRRDNINAGGANRNCDLAQVHPDNLSLALDIARLFRLDFAGIDLIIRNIAQSWRITGGVVCEVNAQPQLRASDDPAIYQGILRKIFATGTHIPADLTILPQTWEGIEALAQELSRQHPTTHISCTSGLWLAGHQVSAAFNDGYEAALAAMLRTDVHSLHALISDRDVLQHGLPGPSWGVCRLLHFNPHDHADRIGLIRQSVHSYFQKIIE